MHHIVNPVVVDGVVEHSRPECREQGLPAGIFIQDDEPRHQKKERGRPKRHGRVCEGEKTPRKRG